MTILHMRNWLDAKEIDQQKLQQEKDKLAGTKKEEDELKEDKQQT